ncbi:MAG: hypothetical protein LQ350_004805 [Teloschistes chrysophthalmus]|nr:MAG: hypothetical protein LQ350_004805 [Niorma chrysophthalma]
MSSIQVSVSWVEPAVFAGEDVKCIITFRNTAQESSSRPVATHGRAHEPSNENRDVSHRAHSHCQGSPTFQLHDLDGTRLTGHRIPSPLTSPRTAKSLATKSDEGTNGRNDLQPEREITYRRHRRSVSIVSVGSDAGTSKRPPTETLTSARSGRGHGRAVSLQVLPERVAASNKDLISGDGLAGPSIQMRGYNPAISPMREPNVPLSVRSSSIQIVPRANPASDDDIQQGIPLASLRSSQPRSRSLSSSIRELPEASEASSSNSEAPLPAGDASANNSQKSPTLTRFLIQRQSSHVPNPQDHLAGISTATVNEATPRSSTDLCSRSNDSLDTLASVYVHQDHSRFPQYPVHTPQPPLFASSKTRRQPEALMMGYANLIGYFHIDTSLINASPFDEVKSKGVVGSQGGGGVVRPGAVKHRSGLLGSLGLNSLGESLGGLLGSTEVSSIKETMGSTTAKWIPIISTSQSLLFVDLRLEPGQQKRYSYSYRLPAGIPPSYRGKAIRISYNVVVGVQTATLPTGRHAVRQFEFPIRIFPGVNGMR